MVPRAGTNVLGQGIVTFFGTLCRLEPQPGTWTFYPETAFNTVLHSLILSFLVLYGVQQSTKTSRKRKKGQPSARELFEIRNKTGSNCVLFSSQPLSSSILYNNHFQQSLQRVNSLRLFVRLAYSLVCCCDRLHIGLSTLKRQQWILNSCCKVLFRRGAR